MTRQTDIVPFMQPFGRSDQHFPYLGGRLLFFHVQKQNFQLSPGLLSAEQSGRDDPGIVHDEDVAFFQQVRQLKKGHIRQGIFVPVHQKQAGLVALGRGMLRDQFIRQII